METGKPCTAGTSRDISDQPNANAIFTRLLQHVYVPERADSCEMLANKTLLNALWTGAFRRLHCLKGWLAEPTTPQPRRTRVLRQHFANATSMRVSLIKGIMDDTSPESLNPILIRHCPVEYNQLQVSHLWIPAGANGRAGIENLLYYNELHFTPISIPTQFTDKFPLFQKKSRDFFHFSNNWTI